jgi:hypothetical protein
MDEREAREWLLKRRGGLGKRGTDLADDWALEVLAKAAYKRRKTWVVGILSLTGAALLGLTVGLFFTWLFEGAPGLPALIAAIGFLVFAFIFERVQRYFDDRDFDFVINSPLAHTLPPHDPTAGQE